MPIAQALEPNMLIGKLLGRVRLPAHAKLEIRTQDSPLDAHRRPEGPGSTRMELSATGRGPNQHVHYSANYEGQLLLPKMITDLLSWLKHTARTFWGSENGGY